MVSQCLRVTDNITFTLKQQGFLTNSDKIDNKIDIFK